MIFFLFFYYESWLIKQKSLKLIKIRVLGKFWPLRTIISEIMSQKQQILGHFTPKKGQNPEIQIIITRERHGIFEFRKKH